MIPKYVYPNIQGPKYQQYVQSIDDTTFTLTEALAIADKFSSFFRLPTLQDMSEANDCRGGLVMSWACVPGVGIGVIWAPDGSGVLQPLCSSSYFNIMPVTLENARFKVILVKKD